LKATSSPNENSVSRRAVPPHPPQSIAIASAFPALGVSDGATVAIVGLGLDAYWARLAHVRINVELQARDAFWGRPDLRSVIFEAMRNAGAQFVVSDDPPAWADTRGWQKIGNTSAVMLDLRTTDTSSAAPGARVHGT
jgi:hypothetical protein